MSDQSMLAIDVAMRVHQPHIPRRVLDHINVCRHHAHKFLFDVDASILLGKFSHQCADLVLLHRQFAMPPYDVCYIEVDGPGFLAQLPLPKDDPDVGKALSIAYLIDRRCVYPIVRYNKDASIIPFMYYFAERGSKTIPKQPFPKVDWEGTFGKNGAMTKLSFILGSGTNQLLVEAQNQKKSVIEAVEDVLSEVYYDNEVFYTGVAGREIDTTFLKEMTGDLRHVWAILLWLNSVPRSVRYTPQPAGARLYKGKRMALSAYNTVHIHLKGTVDIRHAYTKATHKRDSPRRHDVRGTWCHHGGQAQGCSHQWPDIADEDGHFTCKRCGRIRWWRKPHQRGDKDKGFIDKEYVAEI